MDMESDVTFDIIRGVICALGIFGNVVVLFVNLILREYQKTVTHWYVMQLAAADLVCLLTIPFTIAEDLTGQWGFPNWTCKVKETIFFVNYYASVMLLATMSIDRYCAVCHIFSTKIQKLRSRRFSILIAVIIWVSSILMSFPIMLYSDVKGIAPYCKCRHDFSLWNKQEKCQREQLSEEECNYLMSEGSCTRPDKLFDDVYSYLDGNSSGDGLYDNYNPSIPYEDYEANYEDELGQENNYNMQCSYQDTGTAWRSYIYWCLIAMFIVPFTLMTFCYSRIVIKLRKSGNRSSTAFQKSSALLASVGSGRDKRATQSIAQRNCNRVTRVCFTLVFIFFLCWSPFYGVHLAKMVGIPGSTQLCETLSRITAALAYSNSALNPYIYNFVGTSFIGRFRKAASSVKSSLRKTTSTFTSDGIAGVRYTAKRNDANGAPESAVITTKQHAGKEKESSTAPITPGNNSIATDRV